MGQVLMKGSKIPQLDAQKTSVMAMISIKYEKILKKIQRNKFKQGLAFNAEQ